MLNHKQQDKGTIWNPPETESFQDRRKCFKVWLEISASWIDVPSVGNGCCSALPDWRHSSGIHPRRRVNAVHILEQSFQSGRLTSNQCWLVGVPPLTWLHCLLESITFTLCVRSLGTDWILQGVRIHWSFAPDVRLLSLGSWQPTRRHQNSGFALGTTQRMNHFETGKLHTHTHLCIFSLVNDSCFSPAKIQRHCVLALTPRSLRL